MPIYHNLDQGSSEWHEFRRMRIMASDIGIIMGLSDWMSPLQIWQQKLGFAPPTIETPRMLRGKELEPKAREKYTEITGIVVQPAVVSHSANGFFAASLDGVDVSGSIICEIKCPGRAAFEEAKNGHVKPLYNAQMQWQMYCMGLSKCHYFNYCGDTGEACLQVVESDPQMIATMIIDANKFLDLLNSRIPPEPSRLDYEDLSRNAEWEALARDYAFHDSVEKEAKKEKENARKKLILLANGRNVQGSISRLTKYSMAGPIQYKNIPELKGIDLEQYRGAPVESYRITITKGYSDEL